VNRKQILYTEIPRHWTRATFSVIFSVNSPLWHVEVLPQILPWRRKRHPLPRQVHSALRFLLGQSPNTQSDRHFEVFFGGRQSLDRAEPVPMKAQERFQIERRLYVSTLALQHMSVPWYYEDDIATLPEVDPHSARLSPQC
jgi:hypothetical protein